jgi:hypothetical protein
MSDQVTSSANTATTEVTAEKPAESQSGNETQTQQDDKEPWRKVKHKYRSAGQDVELEFDEIIKRAQKADGADRKFQDAAAKEKELKARLEKLKNPDAEDWDDLIDLIGFEKAQKFADKLVWDKIQYDELPDHEKKRLQAEKRAEKSESELQQIKDREAEREKQAITSQAMSIIQNEIGAVLKLGKEQGLPAADIPEIEELIVQEMIDYLEFMDREETAGREIKTPPPSHEDVLRKIQERYDQRSDVYVKRLSVDQLKKLLTKEQLAALRQAEIDQLYASTPAPTRGTKQNQTEEIDPFERRQNKKPERRMRTDDFFSKLDQSFGR